MGLGLLDCTIVRFGTGNVVLPIRAFVPKSYAKNNCFDCTRDMSTVFGLCQLYLDCVNCIWIVSIVFGLCRLYCIMTIVFGLCRLYLDYVDCIWIA